MERASATDMPIPASRRLVSTSGSARPIIFNSGTPLVAMPMHTRNVMNLSIRVEGMGVMKRCGRTGEWVAMKDRGAGGGICGIYEQEKDALWWD
jgi:hypothetical protein